MTIQKIGDILVDDPVAIQESGKISVKGWVCKDCKDKEWVFRELSSEELALWVKAEGSMKAESSSFNVVLRRVKCL